MKNEEFKWKYFNSEGVWVRKPPMRWIVKHTKEALPYFFSPDTMRGFHQTIDDFKNGSRKTVLLN